MMTNSALGILITDNQQRTMNLTVVKSLPRPKGVTYRPDIPQWRHLDHTHSVVASDFCEKVVVFNKSLTSLHL